MSLARLTSASRPTTFRPVASAISAAASRALAKVRLVIATSAPASASASAITRPRPRAPPVTRARLLVSLKWSRTVDIVDCRMTLRVKVQVTASEPERCARVCHRPADQFVFERDLIRRRQARDARQVACRRLAEYLPLEAGNVHGRAIHRDPVAVRLVRHPQRIARDHLETEIDI